MALQSQEELGVSKLWVNFKNIHKLLMDINESLKSILSVTSKVKTHHLDRLSMSDSIKHHVIDFNDLISNSQSLSFSG